VKAVFAKSFARIHRRNLVAQGILALTFKDDADYDRAEVGECWTLPKVREELEAGADEITVRIEDSGDEFALTHDLAPKEREILLCGGLLELLRRASEDEAAGTAAPHEEDDGGGADNVSRQREAADQGVGGQAG
jgi:aconitate hydratase